MPKLEEAQIQKIADQVLNSNQKKLFDENLEIDFSTQLDGRGRFRVNIFQQLKGVSAVFRTIPDNILSIVKWTPIPYLVDTPVSIATGIIEYNEWINHIIWGSIWGLILTCISLLIYQIGIKGYEAYGQ